MLASAFLISKPQEMAQKVEEIELQAINENDVDDTNQYRYELAYPSACFQSKRFHQYLFMMFAGNIFGGFFSYQFKIIGNSHGGNDLVLAAAASAAGFI